MAVHTAGLTEAPLLDRRQVHCCILLLKLRVVFLQKCLPVGVVI